MRAEFRQSDLLLGIVAVSLLILGAVAGLLILLYVDLASPGVPAFVPAVSGLAAFSIMIGLTLFPRNIAEKIVGFIAGIVGTCLAIAYFLAGLTGLITATISVAFCPLILFVLIYELPRFKLVVEPGSALVIRERGQLLVREHGTYRRIPIIRDFEVVGKPIATAEMTYLSEVQELLTKSLETVKLKVIANYRIKRDEVTSALTPQAIIAANDSVPTWREATEITILTVLNEQFNRLNLRSQVLEHWKDVREELQQEINKETVKWGVEITKVSFRNIRIEEEALESLAAEAKVLQKGELERLDAEALRDTISSLREAGLSSEDIITVKYIEALKELARSPANKIILPYEIGEAMKRLGGILNDELSGAQAT